MCDKIDKCRLTFIRIMNGLYDNCDKNSISHYFEETSSSLMNHIKHRKISLEDIFYLLRSILSKIEFSYSLILHFTMIRTQKTKSKNKIKVLPYRVFVEKIYSFQNSWNYISKDFHFVFWRLSLSDIYIAVELYQSFCRKITLIDKEHRYKSKVSYHQIFCLKKEFESKIR